jgi:hypothetical protein
MLAQARVDLYNQPTGLNLFAGGLTVLLFVLASVGLLGYWRNARAGRLETAGHYFVFLVYGTVAFQFVHTVEHFLQTGFWIRRPYSLPWLSPWALSAQKGLTTLFDSQARVQSGNEILHLLGNGIFFAGLVAIVHALRRAGTAKKDRRYAVWAFWAEGIHMSEHVVLTLTWYLFGVPRGISTLFGLTYKMQAPWASGIRILWHFAANAVPMVLVLAAVRELKRAGLLEERGFIDALSAPKEPAVEGNPAR